MKIIMYEEEMIKILDSYVKEKLLLEKQDSFIVFEDDENLKGLHFTFLEKKRIDE